MMFFKIAQKVIIKFGHFLKKICDQDRSKITQSGHTAVEGEDEEEIIITLSAKSSSVSIELLWKRKEYIT